MDHTAEHLSSTSMWRQVVGTVTRSEVVFDGEDYRPVVEYKYEVDGVAYVGNTITAGMITFNWRGPATRLVKRFPVGAKVPVFVHPVNPQRASLQLGMDKNLPLFLISFSGLLIFFVLVYFLGIRK
jgi:hypothetical protein